MFVKIVVGVDGHAGGSDALALATELIQPGGELHLANVYFGSPPPENGSAGQFVPADHRHSLEVLQAARAEAGIEAKLSPVASPQVGRGLHELAEGIGADLIVVGSSRRGLLGRVLHGDDMSAALNGGPCAVAIAPVGYAERPRLIAEIGVAYDGSPESRFALTVARDLAGWRGARVSVFEAVSLQPGYATPRHPSSQTMEEQVEQTYERLVALGDVEAHAAYGDPAEELALYGASVDLLIIGSRGYGPLGRLVHGSTSNRLARSARCPLLIVPRAIARRTVNESAGRRVTAV